MSYRAGGVTVIKVAGSFIAWIGHNLGYENASNIIFFLFCTDFLYSAVAGAAPDVVTLALSHFLTSLWGNNVFLSVE